VTFFKEVRFNDENTSRNKKKITKKFQLLKEEAEQKNKIKMCKH
jgi:hypothetical protein